MYEKRAPTIREPESAFPIVTGIRFFKRAVFSVIPEEHKRPAGNKNILATECSNPIDTNVEMQSKMLMYLPIISLACIERYTARHTSQLQRKARTRTGPSAMDVLLANVEAAKLAAPPDKTPEYLHKRAKVEQAIKFPR